VSAEQVSGLQESLVGRIVREGLKATRGVVSWPQFLELRIVSGRIAGSGRGYLSEFTVCLVLISDAYTRVIYARY
jgi:hypothetical protein